MTFVSKSSVKFLIIASVLIAALVLSLMLLLRQWKREHQEVLSRCADYDPATAKLILDCYGIISIISSNTTKDFPQYTVQDHKHSRPIASINGLNDFRLIDDRMHVINLSPSYIFDPSGKRYITSFYINGQLQVFHYDKMEDIPTYLIVNTKTGDVRPYNSIDQVPQDEQSIFRDLEKQ